MLDQILILAVTFLGGGGLSYLIYYKPNIRRAQAVARGSELDNTEKAVRIWRELAQGGEDQVKALREEVKTLRIELNEVKQQVCTQIECADRKQ